MRMSKNYNMKNRLVTGALCLLTAQVFAGTVADLEQQQAANTNLVHHFTFEGTYNAGDGSGSWLDNKAVASPDMIQDGFEDPARKADQQTSGYDSSSKFANFDAFASGAKGDGLKSAATITYATFGTIEYMVQFGTIGANTYMISGDGSGANDRLRFLTANGTKAQMTMGSNVPRDLIGGTSGIPYTAGDWYYVAQTWNISGGNVTLNAWVANMSAATPTLTKTINGLSNAFVGDTTSTMYLGTVNGSSGFMDGGLDALAVYDAVLGPATIESHFNAVYPVVVPVVSGLSATYRHGQVFIQWDESISNNENMRVYMNSAPITSNNFSSAQLVEQRIEPHSANDWYADPSECPGTSGPTHGWIIENNGSELNRQHGLFVHTVEASDPSAACFAVLAENQGAADLIAGENSMTQAVAVSVAPIQAIWQLGSDTVDWAAASNKPLAMYLHPHTSKPSGSLNYLIFGGKTMGWREGLPFKFKVEVLTKENVVLVEPYNRLWINRKLGVSETYESYNREYKNIETWHFGASDKIYDPVERYNGTVIPYTQRLYLWMRDWVAQAYQIDTNKVYAYGTSMGTGAQLLVMRNPDRFASVDLRVPFLDWGYVDGAESNAKRLEAACGPMSMPTSEGLPLSKLVNMVDFMRNTTKDLPHVTIRVGRQDTSVYWAKKPPYMEAMRANRHGFLAGWDNGTHTTAMTGSAAAFPDFRDYSYAVSNFALNKSYPAFSNFSMNDDPGDGNRTDGDIIGFINRGLEWSGIVDLSDKYEITIQSTLPDTVYPVTVDVTLRNLQIFNPQPGQRFLMQNRDGTDTVVEEKTIAVDYKGLLTFESFSITSEQGNSLRIAAAAPLSEAESPLLDRVNALKDEYFESPDHGWADWVVVNHAPTRIHFDPWTNAERQTYIDTYDPDHFGLWSGPSMNRGDYCRARGRASNTSHEYGGNEDLNELRNHTLLEESGMATNGVAVKEDGSYSNDGWNGANLMCHNAPKWHEMVIQSASRQAAYGTSIFHDRFGTILSWLDQGYCPWCNLRFKEFMQKRFVASELFSMGFDTNAFDLVSYVASRRHLGNAILEDPIVHEYIRFQYANQLYWAVDIIDHYHQSAARENRPIPAFYGNQGMVSGERVFDVVLSDHVDIVWSEQSRCYQRPLNPDVQAFSTLLWKVGRAASHYKKPVWAIQYQAGVTNEYPYAFGADKRYPTALANVEAVANGGVPVQTWVASFYGTQTISKTLKEGHRQHSQFVSQNRGLFVDRASIADHAVVYSVPSMFWRYCYKLTILPALPNLDHFGAAGRLLEDWHVPYNVLMLGHEDVFDDSSDLVSLVNYKTIVLPYVDCISDYQAVALKDWTRAGGKLILWAKENVGTRDEELAVRGTQVFDDLIADPGWGTVETISTSLATNYINKAAGADDTIAAKIVDSTLPVLETTAPETVWLNVWQHGAGPMTSVQMFNNDLDVTNDTISPATNFTVTLREPGGVTWMHADYYNTDYDGLIETNARPLSFTRIGDYVQVTVTNLDLFGILVFSVDDELDARMEAGQTRKEYERLKMALRCPDADEAAYTNLLGESETLLGQIQGDVVVSNFSPFVSQLQTKSAELGSALNAVTVSVEAALNARQMNALNVTAFKKYDFGKSGAAAGWTEVTANTQYTNTLGHGWLGISTNAAISLTETFSGLPDSSFPDDLDLDVWTHQYRFDSIIYSEPPSHASFNGLGQLVLSADSSEAMQLMSYTVNPEVTGWEAIFTVQPQGPAANGYFNINIENGARTFGRFQIYLDKDGDKVLSVRAGATGWSTIAAVDLGTKPSELKIRCVWNASTRRMSAFYGINGQEPTNVLTEGYPQSPSVGRTKVELRNNSASGSTYITKYDNWTFDATLDPAAGEAQSHGATDLLHKDFIRSKDPANYSNNYPGNNHYPYTNPETTPGTFRIDLPNDEYMVTVISGDYDEYRTETGGPANEGRTAMTRVEAAGEQVLYGDLGRGGYFPNRAFKTTVTDGHLDLIFGGNAVGPLYCNPIEWIVNGLIIQTTNQTPTTAAQAYIDRAEILNRGAIRSWMIIGPFDDDDCRGMEIINGPETNYDPNINWAGKPGAVVWKTVSALSDPAPYVPLANLLGDTAEVSAFCQTYVYCPHALSAKLVYSMSQTGIGWVNGQEVFRDEVSNGLILEEETVDIFLNQGWNSILLKSMNHWGSEWTLHASLLNDAGQPLIDTPAVVIAGDTGDAAYSKWIDRYSVGTLTNMMDNADGDNAVNLGEWALGGDPADINDIGYVSFRADQTAESNRFEYVYAKRNNADILGLEYHLEVSTNLATGSWTNGNYVVIGTGILDAEFDLVTNRLTNDSKPAQFIRLIIESR